MLKVFLIALIVAAAFLSCSQATAAESVVFVPKADQANGVPIEVVFPTKHAAPRAYAKAQALKRLIVGGGFYPQPDGDEQFYWGKCITLARQMEIGEATLRVECWSEAMWFGDIPFYSVGQPESPGEAMALITSFLKKHRERLARPRTAPVPVVSPRLSGFRT